MHPSSIAVNSNGVVRELNYTCFPVKLFRIVSSEKYCSLWWVESGSHFVVDVPRFEQEILRNESIPEEDGFKTITFTSFIRQLNLYGFRKVAVDNETHVDPRDWQRYAHPFFLQSRVDYLSRIKRQSSKTSSCSLVHRNTTYVTEALQGYNLAMTQHFLCKGIRPSRKGPKPRYAFVSNNLRPMRREAPRRRKQYLEPLVDYGTTCGIVPLNVERSRTLQACIMPPSYNQNLHVTQVMPDGSIWETVHMDTPAMPTITQQQGNPIQAFSNGMELIEPGKGQIPTEGWQHRDVPLSPHYVNQDNATSQLLSRFDIQQNVLLEQPSTVQPAVSTRRQVEQPEVMTLPTKDKNLNQSQSLPATPSSSAFDTTLNVAVLDDDIGMGSNTPHYCVIDDVGNIKLWQEESSFQNDALISDQVIFGCTSTE